MGTRHLIRVKKDGKLCVSQYGQWDGYPTGQGKDVLKFVAEDYWCDALESAIENGDIIMLSQSEWNGIGAALDGFVKKNGKAGEVVMQMYMTSVFCRDAGAKSLTMLAKCIGKRYCVRDDMSDWIAYEYIIDYDTRTVTINKCHSDGKTKEYAFDDIRKMSEDDIQKEMERLENEWKESNDNKEE